MENTLLEKFNLWPENSTDLTQVEKIVFRIATDIWDRKGLGDEWTSMDDEIKDEILNNWHKIINAGFTLDVLNQEQIQSKIEDHIFNNIILRDVPYSMQDGAMEIDTDSVEDAARAIVKMLGNK